LTVVLAIVILAALTGIALTVLHWVQRRSASLSHEAPFAMMSCDKVARDFEVVSLNNRKADYEQFLQ
jgi:type II secretory pathway component PulJ